jgi:hypothetical protein
MNDYFCSLPTLKIIEKEFIKNMRNDREIRILASSPDYEEIHQLTTKIAMLKNPHMHTTVQETPQAELEAALIQFEQDLQELLDFQHLPFNKVLQKICMA